jgi:AcrR family transcriptional regulator
MVVRSADHSRRSLGGRDVELSDELRQRGRHHGTSTTAIARRVGVTLPYLFPLYPDKRAIFVAALLPSMEDTRLAFARASDGVEVGEHAFRSLAEAYAQLIATHPETLLIQMQGYVTVAHGDDLIGGVVRAGWMRIWDTVHLSLGADAVETASFFALRDARQNPRRHRAFPERRRAVRGVTRQRGPAASSRVVTVGMMSPVSSSAPIPARALAPSKTSMSCRAGRSESWDPPFSASTRKKPVRSALV